MFFIFQFSIFISLIRPWDPNLVKSRSLVSSFPNHVQTIRSSNCENIPFVKYHLRQKAAGKHEKDSKNAFRYQSAPDNVWLSGFEIRTLLLMITVKFHKSESQRQPACLPSVGHPKMSLVDLATASSHAIALKKIKATTRQGMFSSFYSSSSSSLCTVSLPAQPSDDCTIQRRALVDLETFSTLFI